MLKTIIMIFFALIVLSVLITTNVVTLKEGFGFGHFIQNQIKRVKKGLHAGEYPDEQTILDDYPLIGKNTLSNNSYSDIWKDKPTYQLGSYKQLTNNQKYHANPDDGTCVRADFCGALYKNKQVESNIIHVLPPVPIDQGIRVGYFIADTGK